MKRANYRVAFEILLEYWDSLPDEEKDNIDRRLREEANV